MSRADKYKVTASATLHRHELKNIPVLNPGGWFGKAWLIEIGGSYAPLFLIVEANSMSDAIDELADNDDYGDEINVPDSDLDDYPEDERYYAGNDGHVIDLNYVWVYGDECTRHANRSPFNCKYHAEWLPSAGIDPCDYLDAEDWQAKQEELAEELAAQADECDE